jgi:hypothetical protein
MIGFALLSLVFSLDVSLDVLLESTLVGKRKQVKQGQASGKTARARMAAARRGGIVDAGLSDCGPAVILCYRQTHIEATMTATTSAFQLSLNGHRAPVAYDRRETRFGAAERSKEILNPMPLSFSPLENAE